MQSVVKYHSLIIASKRDARKKKMRPYFLSCKYRIMSHNFDYPYRNMNVVYWQLVQTESLHAFNIDNLIINLFAAFSEKDMKHLKQMCRYIMSALKTLEVLTQQMYEDCVRKHKQHLIKNVYPLNNKTELYIIQTNC